MKPMALASWDDDIMQPCLLTKQSTGEAPRQAHMLNANVTPLLSEDRRENHAVCEMV